jgi:ATP-binding cassette subfamily B protein
MFRSKRVPVVLQMSAADCGAACLSMILGYWDRRVSAGTCQAAMGGGQNGVTALMIARAARAFGLEVQAFRHTPQGLADAPLPAILHWQGVHFVVLEAYGPEAVKIVDPAVGRRALTPDEFAAGYSGVTLTFAPGPDFAEMMAAQARNAPPATWRAYVRRVLAVPGSGRLLGWLLAASLLLQLAGLILPLVTWLVVERILPAGSRGSLALLGCGMAVALLAQAGIVFGRDLLVIHLQQRLDRTLIPDFFRHLLGLPYAFFQQRTTGDLLSRLEGNAAVRELITSGVLTGLLDGGLSLLYLLILYAQSPLFGLVVTGTALGHFLLLAATGERVHEYSQMELATQAEEESLAVQIVRGIESVKSAGAEAWILAEWDKRFGATLQASARRGRYVARINAALQLLSIATPLLLLWLGVGAVQSGQLSLGQMLALVVLASSSLAPLGSLAAHIHRAQQIWAYLERLGDVWEAESEEESVESGRVELGGALAVEGLTFRYGEEGVFGLHDISFAVAAGESIAIVGPTGAGKSTLARLLLGLYRPQAGVIRYDGRPLDELGLTRLRREIGVVLQESFLLGGTIRANIALQQPDMPLDQIVAAAKLAEIHAEIERLPMGYESRVGEGGSGLSGGQRQRIALARALATKPAILILDEATSHLDAVTESAIQRNLDGLAVTRITIAHRLSSVRSADRILVLDGGRLVEAGNHSKLIGLGGVYSRLVGAQSDRL